MGKSTSEETFSFNTAVAAKLKSTTAAVVHAKIAYFVALNTKNKHQEENGLFWTNLSITQLHEYLPFLSEKQIRTATDKLKKEKAVLTKESHNNGKYRTTWYSIHPQTMARYYPHILDGHLPKKANNHSPKRASDLAQMGTTICPNGQNINNNRHNNNRQPEEEINSSSFKSEKEHFCSNAEYHKWKPLLLRNLRLDKPTYDAIQTLVSKYGDAEVIEYIQYWQSDNEYYNSSMELLDKVESDLRWKHRK